jgi:hypothetical protein
MESITYGPRTERQMIGLALCTDTLSGSKKTVECHVSYAQTVEIACPEAESPKI